MTTSVSTDVPEPTAEERELTAKQVELAEFQLEELRSQRIAQKEFAAEVRPFLDAQTAEAERQATRARALEPVQDEVLQLQLEDLRRGGAASPEQQALLDQLAEAGIEAGEGDIERFRTESLEALREELAPALGLRSTDTPILDRGGRVAAEATRIGGTLAARLREAALAGKVNLGLASSQLTQSAGLGLARITDAAKDFQARLSQQAFLNRTAVAGQQQGLGLALAGNPAATLQSALNPLVQDRLSRTTTTTSGFGQFISPLIGAGGAIGASLAPSIPAAAASSERFKTDIEDLDDGEVLAEVERLPVKRWRYREGLGLADGKTHVGPMAEGMKGIGLSDGNTVYPMDTAGLGLAATKALIRKVERMERGLGLADAA